MLEALLRLFNISVVNTIILLIITSIFIVGLIFTKKDIHKHFVSYIPTLLTTVGIFGTFLGIVLGLLNFNQYNIEASIPPLLEGLKTAFITSLAGIFASLIFKTLSTFSFLKPEEKEDERYLVTPMDYLAAIQSQADEIKSLRKTIVANNEPSLSYQLNSLRMDINANAQLAAKRTEAQFQQLQQLLNTVAEAFCETTTKQSIDALKGAVDDFNLNLTEQFGVNFKYFNDGLAKSIEWQENCVTQFETMKELYESAANSLKISEASVMNIAEHSQKIPQTMEDLKNIIHASQYQLEMLGSHLDSFREMREKAVDAIPQINEHLHSTIDSLATTVTSVNNHHQNLLTESGNMIQTYIKTSNEFIEQFSYETNTGLNHMRETNSSLVGDMEQMKNSILSSSEMLEERLSEIIEQAAEQQIQQAQRAFEAMEEQIEAQAGFTAEAVSSQLKIIDEATQHEIQHVMSEMGQALTKISGQFVDDYSKLTSAMKRIIINQKKMNKQAE